MSEAGTPEIATEEAPAPGRSFVQRLVGAFRLEGSVYDEIADDAGAIGQAAGVAVCASLARAVGVFEETASGQALGLALSVLGFWPLASVLVWAVGNLLRSPAEFGRVLRVVGFAMAPLILLALVAVPNLWFRSGVLLVTYALLFGALVVGVRAAMRVDTGRATFLCVVVGMAFFFLYSIAVYLTLQPGGNS